MWGLLLSKGDTPGKMRKVAADVLQLQVCPTSALRNRQMLVGLSSMLGVVVTCEEISFYLSIYLSVYLFIMSKEFCLNGVQ